MNTSVALQRAAPRRSQSLWAALREQATVASGQLVAGVGNMLFALILARELAPAGFAHLAAFLALYLLIHLPARSLGAATALAPESAAQGRRHALHIGLAGSLVVLAVGLAGSELLRLPVGLVGALATTPILASQIAVERGRLYGEQRHRQVVGSLLVEPVVRLGAGVALAVTWGAEGAAAGVVLSDVGALVAARLPLGARNRLNESGAVVREERETPRPPDRAPMIAVACFLLVALLQSSDVVYGNATLPDGAAGQFAALSTLGGISAFATVTVPFVLLPRAQEGQRGALGGALATAALLGAGAVAVVLIAPGPIIELVFGDRYAALAPLAALYLGAMALLGVGRVLVANAAATGAGRLTALVLALVSIAHFALMVQLGDTVRGLAIATLIGTGLMLAGLAAVTLVARRRPEPVPAEAPLLAPPPALVFEPQPAFAVAAPAATLGGSAPAAPPAPAIPPAPPEAPDRPPPPAPERREPTEPFPPVPEPDVGRRRRRRLITGAVLIGLMGLALVLRVVADRSIWLDEATSWYQAELPFGAMLNDLRATDVHPPLFYSLLWLAVRVFGDGELALRSVSISAGVALVPMLFVAGRAIYDRRTGLIAAAFGTFAPILIWYSHEARMYALLVLFGVIAVWSHYQAIETFKVRYWVIYPVAAAAMVWTQYFAVFPVAVLQAVMLVELWRRGERSRRLRILLFLGTSAAIVALLAPLIPFALDQFLTNQDAGKGLNQPERTGGAVGGNEISPYAGLSNVIWAIWGYHSPGTMTNLVALWPLLVLGAFLTLGRRPTRGTYLLVAVAAVPAIALTALALFQPFLFELRFNLTAVPLLALLGARVASSVPATWVGRGAVIAAASATLLLGTADQQLNGSNPRLYDFEGALNQVKSRAGPGDVLLYEPRFLNNVIDYYAPDLDARAIDTADPLDDGRAKHIFVLRSFSDDPATVRATGTALAQLQGQRTLIDRFSEPQVAVWELR